MFLHAKAMEAAEAGRRPKAARRLQKAVEYDPTLELGPYLFLVADVYFEDKNFGRAAPLYRSALEAHPDTSIAETASFNMAISYDEMGWHSQAREAYEELLDRFPRGEFRSDAAWRLSNLLYEEAEKQHVLGNYEETVETLGALVERTTNRGLLQKTHFLLGETYEAMGELKAAHREYREVIEVDRGASGRIVERAREKIAALQEAGLY
jgi:tetratricopeptide (TPR) repeat protein